MESKRLFRNLSITSALTLVLLIAGIAIYFFVGFYDMSADSPDNPVVAWVIHKTYLASLHRHARDDLPPSDLMSLKNIQAGGRFYDSTCAACHGVPGITLSIIGRGLQPAAPALLAATRRNTPTLMFWVIKHGVNMTAMPSFGKTQSDKRMWQTAAFLLYARGISREHYEALFHNWTDSLSEKTLSDSNGFSPDMKSHLPGAVHQK